MARIAWSLVLLGSTAFGSWAAEPESPPLPQSACEFPDDVVRFSSSADKQVFQPAGPGHWDVKIRERGWVLRENDRWHLWYTGYDGTREGLKMLGYATSADGLTWKRNPANPLDRGHWIEDMMVVRDGGRYLMFAEGRGDQAHWFTSPDGVHWTRQGALDIRLADGRPIPPGPFGTPTVWREEDGAWYLMYERRDQGVWLARSPDLKTWTNVQDEPVLKPGPDAYDREMIAVNQVIRRHGRYYAYYHASGDAQPPRKWTTNVAVSSDRVHWKKYSGNPIVPGNRSSGIVVPLPDGTLRLYTMHDTVEAFTHFKEP